MPLVLFISYPFYTIIKKVQYSGFEGKFDNQGKINQNTFKNSFKAIKNLYKFDGGLKAFY